MTLLWPMAQTELEAHCQDDNEAADWLRNVHVERLNLLDEVADLDPLDTRRLAVLNPSILKRTLRSQKVHILVSTQFKAVLDQVMIQRSLASELPMEKGQPIPLKNLFKKMIRKTATTEFVGAEEIEYQYWHRRAAK